MFVICGNYLIEKKIGPVNDFRGLIQATVGYSARNRKFSNFVIYGMHLVTEWSLKPSSPGAVFALCC